jgi:hypothetical protein
MDRLGRVFDDLGHGPHALVTACVGNDAERAELVAALDDRDVGLDRVGAPGDAQRERDVVHRIDGDRGVPPRASRMLHRVVHEHRQTFQILRTDNDVDRRRSLQNPRSFLLRDAARDGNNWTAAGVHAHLANLPEPREQLLLGALAYAARVDHDDVGVAVVVCRLVAGLFEEPGHAFRVVNVHLAAVCLDEIFSRHYLRLSLSPFDLLSPFAGCLDDSISRALVSTAVDTSAPPIIRASSSSRSRPATRLTSVIVRPLRTDFAMQ